MIPSAFQNIVNRESDSKAGVPDVLLALAFGCHSQKEKDITNIHLADAVKEFYKEHAVPVIAQGEIHTHLGEVPSFCIDKPSLGKYLDTYDFLIQARDICRKNGWSKIVLCVHPDHYWRVQKVAKKLGFISVHRVDTTHVPYNPESDQSWTRNKFAFMCREYPARILYFLKRWL